MVTLVLFLYKKARSASRLQRNLSKKITNKSHQICVEIASDIYYSQKMMMSLANYHRQNVLMTKYIDN